MISRHAIKKALGRSSSALEGKHYPLKRRYRWSQTLATNEISRTGSRSLSARYYWTLQGNLCRRFPLATKDAAEERSDLAIFPDDEKRRGVENRRIGAAQNTDEKRQHKMLDGDAAE